MQTIPEIIAKIRGPIDPEQTELLALADAYEAQRKREAILLNALGLVSTLKGDMEINVDDPIGMMHQVCDHVTAERDRLNVDMLQLVEQLEGYMKAYARLRADWKAAGAELPDSDETVLGYHPEWSEPVWPCYHDGDGWRTTDGVSLRSEDAHADDQPPTHWRRFPEGPPEEKEEEQEKEKESI